MSSTTPRGPAPDSPSGVRPLPPKPSLEFERKHAKKLLTKLRRGAPDAIQRASGHASTSASATGAFKLADAQFVIAREYGFRSWPRLVEYFTTLERHERTGARPAESPTAYEGEVEHILREHRAGRSWVAQMLGTFVPRFYGVDSSAIAASEVTIDDVRLVVARQRMCPSWEVLLAQPQRTFPTGLDRYELPATRAHSAVRRGDLAALTRIVDEHPELITASGGDAPSSTIIFGAVFNELREQTERAKHVTDWLIARGANATEAWNRQLITLLHTTVEEVAYLLARGADPEWVPANGITVLEHAICRYWSGAAVDLIAERTVPRQAFWIAAGIGDAKAVTRYLDPKGKPTSAARRHRPDFTAIGPAPMPLLPDADDLAILAEAFLVAGLNCRVDALDILLDAGFPIDHPWNGTTLLHLAVGNRLVGTVEYLVSRGADLELKGWMPTISAREAAEVGFQNAPDNPASLEILRICGGRDPETLRAIADSVPRERTITPGLARTLKLASDEAAHLGQSTVEPHNIFVALVRGESVPPYYLDKAGVDMLSLRNLIRHRLGPIPSRDTAPTLPWTAEAQHILEAARAAAERRRRYGLTSLHVLEAIAETETGVVADWLRSSGSEPARLREVLTTN